MAQTDPIARTKDYRTLRARLWKDLEYQHVAYILYFQEHEGLERDDARIDESRFRGPVNVLVDELLTHSSKADAASLAAALPAGWGAASENLLYDAPDKILSLIERSLPDRQWGEQAVNPAVASDPARWEPWLRSRLQLLGVPGEHAFPAPVTPPTSAGTPPPQVARSRSRVVVPIVGSVAFTVGAYTWLSWRAARRREA